MADLGTELGTLLDGAPSVGVLIDTFHLYAAGETIEAGLAWGAKRIVWVHVADLPALATPERASMHDHDRGLPGENGAVDCRGWLRRLAEAHYDGPVTVEPLSGCRSLKDLEPEAIAQRAASTLDSVWPRGAGRSDGRARLINE